MSQWEIQHSLQGVSGLAKDRSTNTWYVDSNETLEEFLPAVEGIILNFYSTLSLFFSSAWTGPGETIKFYQLLDAKPRSPISTYLRAAAVPNRYTGGANLPDEVSCCLSYSAGAVSGVNTARRLGRLYLGPLNTTATSGNADESPRPSLAFRGAVLDAAQAVKTALTATACSWVQYSPTGQLVTDVSSCWVDDAFDTQRRRGVQPTGKLARVL